MFRNLYYPERVHDLDVDKWVDYCVNAGATSVCMDVKTQAYLYYDSGFAPKDPALGSRDIALEISLAARRRGIKWSAYIAPSEFECLLESNKEECEKWQIRFEDGSLSSKYSPRTVFCWNSPYLELFCSILNEIALKYHPDGFYLDGVAFPCYYDKITCYCDYCRKRFYEEYGMQMPGVENLNSPSWPAFIQARRKWNAEVAEKIKKSIKSVDPEISIVANGIFGYHGWTCSMSPMAAWHFDLFCFEIPPSLLHRDIRPYGFSVGDNFLWKSAILRGLQRGCPGEYYTAFETQTRNEEIKLGIDLMNAAGTRISVAGRTNIVGIMKRIKEMEPFLTDLKPMPQVSVHFSENSHIFHHKSHIAIRDPEDSSEKDIFFNEIRAFFKAASDARYAVELLMDEDLANNDFRNSGLLILPDSAMLPEAFGDSLLSFLKGGGTAIATMETGTLDQNGNIFTDELIFNESGLKLIGHIKTRKPWVMARKDGKLEFENQIPAVPAQYLSFKEGILGDWLGEDIATHYRYLPMPLEERELYQLRKDENSVHLPQEALRVKVENDSWKVLATIKYLDEESGEWLETPGIISRKFGNGILIYIAFAFSFNSRNCHAWLRHLMKRLIELATGTPPIKIDAPSCVKTTFWRQGERQLIHFVNELSDLPDELEIERRIPVPVKVFIPDNAGSNVDIPIGEDGCEIIKTDKGVRIEKNTLLDRMLLSIY